MRKHFLALAAIAVLAATMSPADAQRRTSNDGPRTTSGSTHSPAVKLSRNGICHPRGGTYYSRTIHFTPFPSMAACIRAGGRPPRR